MRIFLAEKGLLIPLVTVDLARAATFRRLRDQPAPRRAHLVLEDGTAIGEVPAIAATLKKSIRRRPARRDAKEKAQVSMWERRAELEGFAAAMEAIRNSAAGLRVARSSGS